MKKNKPKQTKKDSMQALIKVGLCLLCVLMLFLFIYQRMKTEREEEAKEIDASKPAMTVALLDVNPYSRPGIEVTEIKNVVIHYTANPGSTAMNNRDYFQGLKDTHTTQASSNFVVGLEGEIVQCVPTWEVAYASNDRNIDSVSIEFCHPDETGKPKEATYDSLVQLCGWLCRKFDLTAEEIIRHYDVTGKNCPKYFVEDEKAFVDFKTDVQNAINRGGTDE
ncbi:peptidoglycan recognition protein family protein [Lachnospiraceae bacterium PAL113]|uniref:N-acetylmuramoyl-L-alanine amidase n=1 Tax=Aequitasia blattaphilus TaxID=2949332 RepID=A0ABT1EB63_9FIRM|nr:peptidoglycan recognition family protein [Aequitasia blattaphilus]MCP1101752.1 peptidoglycan recognition protein family protein [Aequitasia blattaphilus]MCR8614392.1 peptidoglycan recognition protein family protein [Aequitasia blattaphilus]